MPDAVLGFGRGGKKKDIILPLKELKIESSKLKEDKRRWQLSGKNMFLLFV